jgi:trk system potassium uptake protein TrkA
MIRRLLPGKVHTDWRDPSGEVVLVEVALPAGWVGHRLHEIEDATRARAVCLTRLGEGHLPVGDMMVQDGDLVHLAVQRLRMSEVEELLTAPVRP